MSVTIDKKALAIELCEEMALLSNKHVQRWRDVQVSSEDIAGMLTGALVNIMSNTAISISPDYLTIAERMCLSVMHFVHRHHELVNLEADTAKGH